MLVNTPAFIALESKNPGLFIRFKALVLIPVLYLFLVAAGGSFKLMAQWEPDMAAVPDIKNPAYPSGKGPVVLFDNAHHNKPEIDGLQSPFVELLRRDGYQIRIAERRFDEQLLEGVDILVLINGIDERNLKNWKIPIHSAYADDEISLINRWVSSDGSLFLIAEHMPYAGAATDLAVTFGLYFNNGFCIDQKTGAGTLTFSRSIGGITDHVITGGRSVTERVNRVMAFGTQAFRAKPGAKVEPLLVLDNDKILMLPEDGMRINRNSPWLHAGGWLVGAALKYGKGRVAVFGDAAMFSAQVEGPDRKPTGFNVPEAKDNLNLALNVIHWLSGLLDK